MHKHTYVTGGAFGDPHVLTLDNKTYTFNGHGEYWLIKLDEAPFYLQARTERAFYSDGNMSDATVYSAFAMKENWEGVTLLQVELNENKNGKLLRCLNNTSL